MALVFQELVKGTTEMYAAFYHDLGSNLLMKFKSDAIVKVIYHGPFCLFMYLLFGAFCGCLLQRKTKIKYACYLNQSNSVID